MKMSKISDNLIDLITKPMENWKVKLTAVGGQIQAEMKI